MKKPIYYGKHDIDDDDIRAVTKVLKSDFLTQGPLVTEFEKNFANYVGSKYAIAVNSGTAALHLCALALKVENGDRILVTTNTFAASANCVRYCGANVEFVDIDRDSFLIDVDLLAEKINSKPRGYYKGIIPVNFAGLSVDLEKIYDIAKYNDMWIIEDACHAPGAGFYDSNETFCFSGSGKYSDLSIFSFHPVKHIAAGEGGMVTTNNKKLVDRVRLLRTHGISKDNNINESKGWYYEMTKLGYNYRLSDIHVALGNSQLKKIDKNLSKRTKIAERYDAELSDLQIKAQKKFLRFKNAYHIYVILTDKRDSLYNFLKTKNIFSQVHYIPLYRLPYYKKFGFLKNDFPNSEYYYSRCLSIPIYPSLKYDEQSYVIENLHEFFK